MWNINKKIADAKLIDDIIENIKSEINFIPYNQNSIKIFKIIIIYILYLYTKENQNNVHYFLY